MSVEEGVEVAKAMVGGGAMVPKGVEVAVVNENQDQDTEVGGAPARVLTNASSLCFAAPHSSQPRHFSSC